MKNIRFIIGILALTLVFGCAKKDSDIDLDAISTPTNVSALATLSQDNTGNVTFFPKGNGVTQYEIDFGDGTVNPAVVAVGQTVTHKYTEGTYTAKIAGISLNGKRTEITQTVVVSLNPPVNLKVTITPDLIVSKKVTVTATADNASFYEVYFGEPSSTSPVTATIGTAISHIYQNEGTYSIRVVAKGAAIKTIESTQSIDVKLNPQPATSALTPPDRVATDVVSIFTAKYTNVAADYFPDWGQNGQGSSWTTFTLNGDQILNYIKLSYQGIQFGSSVDVSTMTHLHFDVWTADLATITTSLISKTNGERPVSKNLTAGAWTSIDIPISDYTSQNNFTVTDIHQLKFEAPQPWAKSSVYIDNIYFYK